MEKDSRPFINNPGDIRSQQEVRIAGEMSRFESRLRSLVKGKNYTMSALEIIFCIRKSEGLSGLLQARSEWEKGTATGTIRLVKIKDQEPPAKKETPKKPTK